MKISVEEDEEPWVDLDDELSSDDEKKIDEEIDNNVDENYIK